MNRLNELQEIVGLENDDAVARIFIGAIGEPRYGRWVELPCDSDALTHALDIITDDGKTAAIITDRDRGAILIGAAQYSDPHKLNEIALEIAGWSDDRRMAYNAIQTDNIGNLTHEEALLHVDNLWAATFRGLQIDCETTLANWYWKLHVGEVIFRHINKKHNHPFQLNTIKIDRGHISEALEYARSYVPDEKLIQEAKINYSVVYIIENQAMVGLSGHDPQSDGWMFVFDKQ